MFADAGAVNQEYIIGTDKSINYYDPATFEQQLRSLPESEIFALQNSANSRQISLTPGLQSILNQVISGKETPIYKEGIFDINTEYGSPLVTRDPPINKSSYSSIAGDYGRAAKGIYGPVLSALVRNTLSDEQLQNAGRIGIPGLGGTSFKAIAEYDSPFFGEGFKGFEEAGARGGRTREELDAILSGGLQPIPGQQIQDFQSEINDVVGSTKPSTDVADTAIVTEANDIRMDGSMVPQPKGPDLAKIAAENNMTIEQVERIVAEQNPLLEDSFDELNFSSVDDFGNSLSSGETLSFSGGAPEMEARRLAYEKSLIGVDEFGFPIERPDAINKKPERPTSISDFTEELASIKPVNVLKTEEDSKIEIEEKFLPTLPDIDLSITQQEADQINQEESSDPVNRKLKEPGFFGSDNFLNFIRNVGGELVRTGQFGTGLASGAAKAAEERAARELMADQEERKYQKEIELATAKARATAGSDLLEKPKDIRELNTQIKTNMSDLEGGVAATGFVDLAIETLEEALESGESVGGFFGALNAAGDSVSAFFGNEKSFADQSAQTKIKKLVEVVRQKNLQAILGESGRTISDKDRAIILQVFGDLELTEDPNVTLGKLRASRASLAQNNIKLKGLIEDNTSYMFTQGTLGQGFGTKLLPQYQRIRTLDPLASQAAAILAQFMGETIYSGNIEEVDL